ncbi:SGNH/GDSL hydrolase family protein [Rhodococcus sp. X156]|uniref:SGNH/GDSL hydrolase family protein n=1 Tax=Rhodococcus sp. X156 TaxID=2499145 RepID=UPI000FDBDFE2|nr:SGNH/GDSL hydrolase family protein [Rhodococcus sp. X156]
MPARPSRPWTRYVAIGDSFTEGMSDAHPDQPDYYVGWADRLAGHLAAIAENGSASSGGPAHANTPAAGLSYANLAIRGRLLADIAGRQTDEAIALAPDLVSISGGGNDIMRPRADVEALAAELDDAVGRLRAAGADVLIATPADPRGAPVVRHTRGRVATYTAHIWTIARKHDAYVLNQWGLAPLQDWRMWADDRIHMTSEGHRRVALEALSTLGCSPTETGWADPLPVQPTPSRRENARETARWAREHLAPWVQRRMRGESSGDLLGAKRPELRPIGPLTCG